MVAVTRIIVTGIIIYECVVLMTVILWFQATIAIIKMWCISVRVQMFDSFVVLIFSPFLSLLTVKVVAVESIVMTSVSIAAASSGVVLDFSPSLFLLTVKVVAVESIIMTSVSIATAFSGPTRRRTFFKNRNFKMIKDPLIILE